MNIYKTLIASIVVVSLVTLFFSKNPGEPEVVTSDKPAPAVQVPSAGISYTPSPVNQELVRQQRTNKVSEDEIEKLDQQLEASAETYLSNMEQELLSMDDDNLEEVLPAWTISRDGTTPSAIALEKEIKVYEPVSYNPEKALDIAVGEIISIALPGAKEYPVIVTTVKTSRNGETSWNGYLVEYQKDYPVTFTLGQHASFATVATPDGLYAMEAVNGNGWVYKTPDLVDLVDPDQPDYLIADQHNHNTHNN